MALGDDHFGQGAEDLGDTDGVNVLVVGAGEKVNDEEAAGAGVMRLERGPGPIAEGSQCKSEIALTDFLGGRIV